MVTSNFPTSQFTLFTTSYLFGQFVLFFCPYFWNQPLRTFCNIEQTHKICDMISAKEVRLSQSYNRPYGSTRSTGGLRAVYGRYFKKKNVRNTHVTLTSLLPGDSTQRPVGIPQKKTCMQDVDFFIICYIYKRGTRSRPQQARTINRPHNFKNNRAAIRGQISFSFDSRSSSGNDVSCQLNIGLLCNQSSIQNVWRNLVYSKRFPTSNQTVTSRCFSSSSKARKWDWPICTFIFILKLILKTDTQGIEPL